MSLFIKNLEPIFLNKSNALQNEIDYLNGILKKDNVMLYNLDLLNILRQNEINIINALEESNIPMIVLQNVSLKYAGFSGNIDYIIITEHNIYIVNTNELYGDITIDGNNNITRKYKKKCVKFNLDAKMQNDYSLIKVIGYDNKKMLDKLVYDKEFWTYCKYILLVGDSSNLDDHLANNAIRKSIVEMKDFISFIEKTDKMSNNKFKRKEMMNIAQNILNKHHDDIVIYDLKYNNFADERQNTNNKIKQDLKKYGYYLASKEKVKPYQIFNDKLIEKIVEARPQTLDELRNIKGIDPKIIDKHGLKIIKIVKNNS